MAVQNRVPAVTPELPSPCETCGRLAFREEAVTLSRSEYEHLLALAKRTGKGRAGRPSRISMDPEMAEFILARVGSMTQAEIGEQLRSTFPADRCPSHSAVSRFVVRSTTPEQRTVKPTRRPSPSQPS